MEIVCLITGGGSGIGAALALRLAGRGITVIITGRRKERLIDVSRQNPLNIISVQSDISSSRDRHALVEKIKRISGSLSYIVHNAGVIEPIRLIQNLTPQEWRKHQAINLEGPLFLTKALLPLLDKARILHISSGAAHHAYPGWGAYCMSKAALHMLYQVGNAEFRNRDILFGSLRPGVVETSMQETIRSASGADFPLRDRFIALKEQGQLLQAEEVARFIEWVLLKSDDEQYTKEEWNINDTRFSSYWKMDRENLK